MYPTKSNIGALSLQSGYITVNAMAHIPLVERTEEGPVEMTNLSVEDVHVHNTVTATNLIVPDVLAVNKGTVEAMNGLEVTGALVTAGGNVDTRLYALEASSSTFTTADSNLDGRVSTLETTAGTLATADSNLDGRVSALETYDPLVCCIETTDDELVGSVNGDTMFNGALNFNYNVLIDTHSLFNTGTKMLTIASDGLYSIELDLACALTSVQTPFLTMNIYKNVSTAIYTRANARLYVAGGRSYYKYSTVVSLTAGDTLSVYLIEASSNSVGVYAGSTFTLRKL